MLDMISRRVAGIHRPQPDRRWLPVIAPVPFLIVAGALLFPQIAPDSFSAHMALHIATMNVLAPLCAVALMWFAQRKDGHAPLFWLAVGVQLSLLWAWHLPAAQHLLSHGHVLSLLTHAVLFISALLFWVALLRLDGPRRWHGVLGLLISGKLFCLLAALLVFAPRALYGGHAAPLLSDQQLAGLIMITACPLSYVLAGIVLTVQLVGPAQRASGVNAKA